MLLALKQDDTCVWCNETSDIVPMVQGGYIHTNCIKCGTKGPVMPISEFREAYMKMLREGDKLQQENKELKIIVKKLADGADKVCNELCIIQPFLSIWRKHGTKIADCQAMDIDLSNLHNEIDDQSPMYPEDKETFFKCDECGKYININDFVSGKARRIMLTPDSELTLETYETLCAEHNTDQYRSTPK